MNFRQQRDNSNNNVGNISKAALYDSKLYVRKKKTVAKLTS